VLFCCGFGLAFPIVRIELCSKGNKSFYMEKLTSKKLSDLLVQTKKNLLKEVQADDVPIESIWPLVVGEKIAPLTTVVSFKGGVLVIRVASPTLNNLLSRTEKPKLLSKLKNEFPFLKVRSLVFQTG